MTEPDTPGSRDGIPWRVFLAEAVDRLTEAGIASPPVDARRIVERATGASGAEYHLELDRPATERGVGFFDDMLERRLLGEPLQYVIGQWGFRTLDLFVDRRVLIPRPETEQVVEQALRQLDAAVSEGRVESDAPVVDLGTGSGAIALSLAVERPGHEVWAVDRSPGAAAVARANLTGLGSAATRVRVIEGSWFDPLPVELKGHLGLVVSNPPYVAASDPLPPEVADWEPAEALVPGPTGMEAIATIVPTALDWLAPGCSLVVELAPDQADAAVALALDAGAASARWESDLAGRPRMLIAVAPH
ncbi:MAG: peptide chain release factor N(5)-glutamine methyltransferase [Acidimicrobiales bacterium]